MVVHRKKNVKLLLIILVVIFSTATYFSLSSDNGINQVENTDNSKSVDIDKLKTSAISISGNNQLKALSDYGSGDNKSDPCVIENKTIDGGGAGLLIAIWDTNLHLIIRNCTLFNGITGIYLDNTSNAVITNCSVYYHSQGGILISGASENITIDDVIAKDNSIYGIYITNNSTKVNITKSRIFDNPVIGIYLYNSYNNWIVDNTIILNDQCAISLLDTINITIFLNKINNNKDGINLRNATFTNISYNSINRNDNDGIWLWDSEYNLIANNTINDNIEYGIMLWDSIMNNITGNTLHGNKHCIVYDLESLNQNYVKYNDCNDRASSSDDDDDEKAGLISPFLIILIIGSITTATTMTLYYYNKKVRPSKVKRMKDSSKIKPSPYASKDILNEKYDPNELMRLFEENITSEEILKIEKNEVTFISKEFLSKIDRSGLTGSDKREFLKEMLALQSTVRNEIIDNILKKRNLKT